MDYTLEELIPGALLKKLEQEDKSLVHTSEGWVTVPTSSLLIDNALTKISERLNDIEALVKQMAEDKKF